MVGALLDLDAHIIFARYRNTRVAIRIGAEIVRLTFLCDIDSDAFAGGFIAGYIADSNDLQQALELGLAASAFKHTMPGDFSLSTREDVEQLLKGGRLRVSR